MSSEYDWTAGENHNDVYFYTEGLQEMMKEYLLDLSHDDEGYNGFEKDSEDELTEEEKRYYDDLADYYDSYYDDYNDY
jgi:hypothetical protein